MFKTIPDIFISACNDGFISEEIAIYSKLLDYDMKDFSFNYIKNFINLLKTGKSKSTHGIFSYIDKNFRQVLQTSKFDSDIIEIMVNYFKEWVTKKFEEDNLIERINIKRILELSGIKK